MFIFQVNLVKTQSKNEWYFKKIRTKKISALGDLPFSAITYSFYTAHLPQTKQRLFVLKNLF